ncbi:hypothetical protein ACERII_06335 [Evansella sp. AB-rgal1]|uniref:hypothetical protein n=1 Tax=Evansella sp. AB-rgal1 TaxID=3242696 RepID=UPI00359DB42C
MTEKQKESSNQLWKQILPFIVIAILVGGIFGFTILQDDARKYDFQPIQNESGTVHSVKPGDWELAHYNEEEFFIKPELSMNISIGASLLPPQSIQYDLLQQSNSYEEWIEELTIYFEEFPDTVQIIDTVQNMPIFYSQYENGPVDFATFKISNGEPMVIHLSTNEDLELDTIIEKEFFTIYKLIVERTTAEVISR